MALSVVRGPLAVSQHGGEDEKKTAVCGRGRGAGLSGYQTGLLNRELIHGQEGGATPPDSMIHA